MKKVSVIVLFIFISGFIIAQDAPAFNFDFNHMALSVKDVERSADFYKNVMNLEEITNLARLEGVRWFSIGAGKELHLISIVREDVTTNKAVHLALTTNNFDAFVSSLDSNHIPYFDWAGISQKINIRADGIKQIFFQDPDGYWLEVNSVGEN